MIKVKPEGAQKAASPKVGKGGVQKTRTASPSGKAAVVGRAVLRKTVQASERAAISSAPSNEESKGPPRKPPAAVAASGEGPFLPVTVALDQPLIGRLDEWAHGKRLTRSAAVRALLERGLPK